MLDSAFVLAAIDRMMLFGFGTHSENYSYVKTDE